MIFKHNGHNSFHDRHNGNSSCPSCVPSCPLLKTPKGFHLTTCWGLASSPNHPIAPSLRGVKRRSNPAEAMPFSGLLRRSAPRNDGAVVRAESPEHTSVGQRPTFGQRNVIKAVSLAHYGGCLCARLSALNTLFCANVGRCPTLICARPLALWGGLERSLLL